MSLDRVHVGNPAASGIQPPILSVQDLRVEFETGEHVAHAVNGVTFSLAREETLAIVGESGSGKSVTSLALMRLLHEPPARIAGHVLLHGEDVLALSEPELQRVRGRKIGMVFQDPTSSLNPVRTIGAQIEEGIRFHLGGTRRSVRQRAVDFLTMVSLPHPRAHLDLFPHELSGGMRQRVMIAIALSCEPEILVADEATTALDVSVQAQILELLRRLVAEFKMSLILISHDLSVVAGLADRIAVMYAGRIIELADTFPLFERPSHPYTRSLLRCLPRVDETEAVALRTIEGVPPDPTSESVGCPFAPRCDFVMDRCLVERPTLEPKGPDQAAACWLADLDEQSVPASMDGRARLLDEATRRDRKSVRRSLLDVKDLKVHFRGVRRAPWRAPIKVRAVDGVTFQVAKGETLGIVGESGSGKSTLAKAILQLEPATAGAVALNDVTLTSMKGAVLRSLRPKMQMVFQDPYGSLNPRMTVGQALAEPLRVHGSVNRQEAAQRVLELLNSVGLDQRHLERYPHQLSGGQRQRVNIARALTTDPRIIVADEPTSALDVSARAQILNLLQELQEKNELTYIFISHDLSLVRHMSDRVAVMYLGRIVELADRDTLYIAPKHPYTQALLSVIPIPDPRVERRRQRVAIPGEIPSPANPPAGCPFHPRCPLAFDRCKVERPSLELVGERHRAACFLASDPVPLTFRTSD